MSQEMSRPKAIAAIGMLLAATAFVMSKTLAVAEIPVEILFLGVVLVFGYELWREDRTGVIPRVAADHAQEGE